MMQFAATIALGLMPLLVFGGAALLRPAPDVVPKPVATEGVTARRIDEATFRSRWRPLYDVAPATVIHEVPVATVPAAVEASSSRPPARRIVKRAALRTDVCARHGMRRIEYLVRGYKRWKCRRGK